MTEDREIKHVYGHFKAAYEIEGVAARPCGECSEAFVRVLLRHVAFCYDRAAFDALSLDEAQLEACRDQLRIGSRRGCVVSLARD